MIDETWYSAQEAVDAGLADQVYTKQTNQHTPPAPPVADPPPVLDPWDIDPEQAARIIREALQHA